MKIKRGGSKKLHRTIQLEKKLNDLVVGQELVQKVEWKKRESVRTSINLFGRQNQVSLHVSYLAHDCLLIRRVA
jgi:hypothetical protein